MKLWSRFGLLVVAIATAIATLMTPISADAAVQCGTADPASMILTMDDFGRSKSAWMKPLQSFDTGTGSQTWFTYGRSDWVEMSSNPYGAFMFGVVATDKSPNTAFQDILGKELGKWNSKEYWQIDVGPRGDEVATYQRLTHWEMEAQTPMVETMIAIRRGCSVMLVDFVTMDEHDPKAQARRYADRMMMRLS